MTENDFSIFTEKLLDECKKERKQLEKKECIRASSLENPKVKDYLISFTNCCYNRMLDIFDDTILLLDNNRIQSACTISRAMIETKSILIYAIDEVNKTIAKSGTQREDIINNILNVINSSRIKVTEQRRLKKGELHVEDYAFTQEAKDRMLNMKATNVNIMDFLRNLYEHEKEKGITSGIPTEAASEQIYDLLSEWVHPSQTSLFINYIEENHNIPCRLGNINIFDSAKYLCSQALSHICELEETYESILQLSEKLPE